MITRFAIGAAALLALVAVAITGRCASIPQVAEFDQARPFAPPEPVSTVPLSELAWEWATTGWVALADDNLPRLDTSFPGDVITLGGRTFDGGIGTFPLSEIVYPLDGKYRLFQAEVGVDGAVPKGNGSVVFKVFLDDVPVYDSGVMRSGMPATLVELSVIGVNRMKLVVEDAGDGSSLDFANWAGARLTPAGTPSQVQRASPLDLDRERRQRQRDRDWETALRRSEEKVGDIARVMEGTGVSDLRAAAVFDEESRQIVLSNGRLAAVLGYGGERHGLLDIVDFQNGTLIAHGTTPSLATDKTDAVVLARHTTTSGEGGYRFQRVEDPVLGSGMEVTADYLVPGVQTVVSPRLTLFDVGSYLTYQLELREAAADVAVRAFSYFDAENGGEFVVGERAVYLTDYSLPRRSEVRDDSVLRQELIGLGKPLLLYDRDRSRGLLMAIIDEVDDPALFSLRVDSGRVAGRLGFTHQQPENVRTSRVRTSPRLFLQVTAGDGFEQATEQYRAVMAALYPAPPIPEWVKYQWGTWYAFYMGYDEEILREQIDYIADNLADLGPWSILLDAGWYVAEGRTGSTWEQVDEEKFPNGIRALVDYAHSRGIKVVLYFSAPYLDDRQGEGNWLGLRGFIEQHPDWVLPLQSDGSGTSYVYDFTHPDLVRYMRKLISDFFLVYDVDGIKIDGLGQAEGEQLAVEERDIFGDVNKIRTSTMDVYRLVYQEAMKAGKEVYIESGWAIPSFANQYAHTFRYGDEFPDFSSRYPSGGLLEHIDYAAIQKRMLGQRPNMGMVWGGPEAQEMVRLWFQAALAMGSQMTLSTDLTRLSGRDLSGLRAVLAHYNAFQGETRFVGVPFPNSFATTSNGFTYLGAVNRGQEARDIKFDLSDYGLNDDAEYLLYDVSSNSYSRVRGSFSAILGGSSFRLFLLRDGPGVVWTNSSARVQATPESMTIDVSGPPTITGFAQIYTPPPTAVRLDGELLVESSRLSVGTSYWYDQDTGVLRLRYRHSEPHTIEVEY